MPARMNPNGERTAIVLNNTEVDLVLINFISAIQRFVIISASIMQTSGKLQRFPAGLIPRYITPRSEWERR